MIQSSPHLLTLTKSQVSLTPEKKSEEKAKSTNSSPKHREYYLTQNKDLKIFGSSNQITTRNGAPSYADYENYFYI